MTSEPAARDDLQPLQPLQLISDFSINDSDLDYAGYVQDSSRIPRLRVVKISGKVSGKLRAPEGILKLKKVSMDTISFVRNHLCPCMCFRGRLRLPPPPSMSSESRVVCKAT